jgi:hypothetical protein
VVLVIDAMDECVPGHAKMILQLFVQNMQSMPSYKLFITTRPEIHIQTVLSAKSLLQPFYLHEIAKSIAQGDIQVCLKHALSKEQIDAVLPYNNWEPTKYDLEILGEKCGILFIMATTAVWYILDDHLNEPDDQMQQLLNGLDAKEGEGVTNSLDKMYLGILQSSIPKCNAAKYLQNFQRVVGTIVILEDLLPVPALAKLLGLKEEDVQKTLQHLHSIMAPGSANHTPQLYHKSFPDFITNNGRCTDIRFLIDSREHHAWATEICFEVMEKALHKNMLDLEGLQKFRKNAEVLKISSKKDAAEVVYACMYWATHLSKAGNGNRHKLLLMLDTFAFTHLLHWIEVLSLIGKLEVAYPAMKLALGVLVREFIGWVTSWC